MKFYRGIEEVHFTDETIFVGGLSESPSRSGVFKASNTAFELVNFFSRELIDTFQVDNELTLIFGDNNVLGDDILDPKKVQFFDVSGAEKSLSNSQKKLFRCSSTKSVNKNIAKPQAVVCYRYTDHLLEDVVVMSEEVDVLDNLYLDCSGVVNGDGLFVALAYQFTSSDKLSCVVTAYNYTFSEIWTKTFLDSGIMHCFFSGAGKALLLQDKLILNLYFEKADEDNGRVVALDFKTGNEHWQKNYALQVDTIRELDDERIILCTGNEIHVLDASTGNTLHQWQTRFDHIPKETNLFVHNNYLFVMKNRSHALQIYRIDDWQLVRDEDLRGFDLDTPFYDEPKAKDNEVYFPVEFYCAGYKGLLLIDTDDIQADYWVEPEVAYELIEPSKEDGRLVFTFSDMDIGLFTRHGMGVVQTKMNVLGRSWLSNIGDELFNGHIHIVLNNISSPNIEVVPVLEQMVKNFASFIRFKQTCDGKGKEAAYLTYELFENGESVAANLDKLILLPEEE